MRAAAKKFGSAQSAEESTALSATVHRARTAAAGHTAILHGSNQIKIFPLHALNEGGFFVALIFYFLVRTPKQYDSLARAN